MTREEIIKQEFVKVESHFKLPTGWIKSRNREFTDVRSVMYYILNKERTFTLAEISRAVDKTHASIINGVKNYESLISLPEYKELDKKIRIILEANKLPTYLELLERVEKLEARLNDNSRESSETL